MRLLTPKCINCSSSWGHKVNQLTKQGTPKATRLALVSSVPGIALASERVESVLAITIFAWVGRTVINVGLAIRPRIASHAGTSVAVHQILARAAILTGFTRAIIRINLAMRSLVSGLAFALVTRHLILTGGPIGTGVGLALIDLCLTVVAFISIVTVACVPIHEICTLPMGCTRRGGALVDVCLARTSSTLRRTCK